MGKAIGEGFTKAKPSNGMALAPTLWWLFAGRIISGICAASISASYAYIADVTPAEKRAARFGMRRSEWKRLPS